MRFCQVISKDVVFESESTKLHDLSQFIFPTSPGHLLLFTFPSTGYGRTSGGSSFHGFLSVKQPQHFSFGAKAQACAGMHRVQPKKEVLWGLDKSFASFKPFFDPF